MIPEINLSAGEVFELIKPAGLILTALVSTWVLASGRKRFSFYVALAWAIATLFLPLVVLPLYIIVLLIRPANDSRFQPRRKVITPFAYGVLTLVGTGIYLQGDTRGFDARLAQAAYAKLRGNHNEAIAEYRAALSENDDPHTHKLLGLELGATGNWTEALSELRLAEQGGEPDDLSIYRIANLLAALNMPNQARLEYQRFLNSNACLQEPEESLCDDARVSMAKVSSNVP